MINFVYLKNKKMKLNKHKNSIMIDCNAVIKEIKIKYGEAPIFSNKYEKIKKSVYKLEN